MDRRCYSPGGWRLVRQLLTQSLILALIGGVGGLTLGAWGAKAMPPDFFLEQRFGFWTPWKVTAEEASARESRFSGIVRLKRGRRGRNCRKPFVIWRPMI
jgi:hypothetical protein